MHPINNTNFGAKAGKLAVKFYDGSSVKTGWVLAQVGTSRYKVTDGTTTQIVTLAQTTTQVTALTAGTGPDAALRATLGTIEITPHGGSLENVKKLTSAQAVTVQGSFITWKLGVASDAAGKGTIAVVANATPTVANAIPDQVATVADAFSYVIPANTFADLNGDTLTYTATVVGGAALSTIGFAFNGTTRTLTKAADASTVGSKAIRVTASDGTASIFDDFNVVVS
jgi:hypothetical protein